MKKISFKQLFYENNSDTLLIFDDEYNTLDDLMIGVKRGELLIHVRRPVDNPSDLKYGLDPEWGETLQDTEAAMFADEYGIEPTPLVFMSDDLSWVQGDRKAILFIKKEGDIQKSLGDGRVELVDGTITSYERSPIADHENPALKGEPFGVETGDWYSKDIVEVAAYKVS
jgi:hypothetical protein